MPVQLVPRCARRIVPAVIVTAALAAAVAVGLAAVLMGPLAAPAAASDASSIAVATTTAAPEQAFPVDLSFSGTNALTGNAEVEAIVRPAGGPPCQTSYQEDTSSFPGEDITIFAPGAQTVAPGAYQVNGSFRPLTPGSYQLCAWLAQNQNSTDQPVAPPASLSLSARGPQVSQLTVAVPKDLQPNVSFQITYTTQTDQVLSLFSVLRPASEAPCPASFSLDQNAHQPGTSLLGISQRQVFGGPATTTATTRQRTGFYVICTWVQGPNDGEVDATATTPVTVGTPPPPKPGLALTKATASRRHGVSVSGTTATGFAGKLVISAACGSATARRTTTARHSRFAASGLRLPRGCRTAGKVRLTVSWAGSSAFAKQSVAKTVAIAR
jgi:hypothetical protein